MQSSPYHLGFCNIHWLPNCWCNCLIVDSLCYVTALINHSSLSLVFVLFFSVLLTPTYPFLEILLMLMPSFGICKSWAIALVLYSQEFHQCMVVTLSPLTWGPPIHSPLYFLSMHRCNYKGKIYTESLPVGLHLSTNMRGRSLPDAILKILEARSLVVVYHSICVHGRWQCVEWFCWCADNKWVISP